MIKKMIAISLVFFVGIQPFAWTYPIDGYEATGIRRLARLQHILDGVIAATEPLNGARRTSASISLNLSGSNDVGIAGLPEVDGQFQRQMDQFFVALDRNYSISVLDMTDADNLRFASRKGTIGYQPGSVGKIAVAAGLFCALEVIFPDDFDARTTLLKERRVKAGPWAMTDEHTVPFYNPETKEFYKRQVQEKDVFSLYEWADHMLSVSNNGAASVLWREVILMHVFEKEYVTLDEGKANAFFRDTPKSELAALAVHVVNAPLREIGIDEDEWRLGRMFTRGATSIIPGSGGSIGTTDGMMKFMVALERGAVVDHESSLEIKRLLYMTDRRIRYASSPALRDAAVYFKSGSLYKCDRSLDPECGKYRGNVQNFMNSVIITEHEDGVKYISVLMSNVLSKNSNLDHAELGGKIDRLIRSR